MATAIAGRLFSPGLAVAGENASAEVRGDTLCVHGSLGALEAPLATLMVARTGFDQRGIALTWNTGRSQFAVTDPAAAAALLGALPADERQRWLATLRPSVAERSGRYVGWSLLTLVLLAPLLLLVLFFSFADPLAGVLAERMSIEQERAFGDASFEAMKTGMQFRDEGPAAQAVREIGARLTAGSRYTYRFHVVEDASVNAFAMPGGIVVVHTGLLAATKRPEELAGVLAHEVQHIELRHSLKGIIKQLGLSALWALATGDLGSGMAGQAAQEVLGLGFSREAEREADEKGLAALVRAGIDPTGMPAFFATLAKQGEAVPALLSTHPQSEDRQQTLAALIARLPAARYEPLVFPAWPPVP